MVNNYYDRCVKALIFTVIIKLCHCCLETEVLCVPINIVVFTFQITGVLLSQTQSGLSYAVSSVFK